VYADAIQPNRVAQGFIDAHRIRIQKMRFMLALHLRDVRRFQNEFFAIHILA
jgi:hypothetical protein